jgi:hypothetical protein
MRASMFSYRVLGLLLGLVAILTGCGVTTSPPAASQSGAQQSSYPPIHMHQDLSLIGMKKPEDLCGTQLTAEVVAGPPAAARWNTPDGTLPVAVARQGAFEVHRQGYFIYTLLTFTRMTPLRDQRQAPTQNFITLGGQVGQDSSSVSGTPQLTPGARYLAVFGRPGALKDLPTGWTLTLYYAFPIDAQDMILFQQAGDPNEPGGGTPQPEIKYSLTYAKQVLAACKP